MHIVPLLRLVTLCTVQVFTHSNEVCDEDARHQSALLQWRRRLDETRPRSNIAVLISGQLFRFVYRDSTAHAKGGLSALVCGSALGFNKTCAFDVYIVLANTKTEAFVNERNGEGSEPSHPPYGKDAFTLESIRRHYLDEGARHVDITLLTAQELFGKVESVQKLTIARVARERGMTEEGLEALLVDGSWPFLNGQPFPELYVKLSNMLFLRHSAYANALAKEKDSLVSYSNFFYMREDNVFVDPDYHLATDADVMVDKYCWWSGHYGDKVYFANRAGADVVFAPTRESHVRHLQMWLNQALESKVGFQVEAFLLKSSGIRVEPFDFKRTEVRYTANKSMPQPCVPHRYYNCTAMPGRYFEGCPAWHVTRR